jgi:2-hydroxy-3-keto-5-methylthiopentenyl-1-phosphate phosphatase
MSKICIICKREKHHSRFGFREDNTCFICRKLLKAKIIVSTRADISQDTFFRGRKIIKCITCAQDRKISEYPNNSYECIYCTNARHDIEAAKLVGLPLDVLCSVCDKIKDVEFFPYGEFICKSCINKTNRYKGGRRYDK